MSTNISKETVAALEKLGFLDEAKELSLQIEFKYSDPLIRQNKNILIWIIARTLEDTRCSKAYFPCAACVGEAKVLQPRIMSLLEIMASYMFFNPAKETDLTKLIGQAFNYTITTTKKHMLDASRKALEAVGKLIQIGTNKEHSYSLMDKKCGPDLIEQDEDEKVMLVRVSQRDENPVLKNADETQD